MASKSHVLMAGGGTAGHVFPGISVAAELRNRGWDASWTGRAGEMEEHLIESQDLEFHPLPAKAVVGRGPLAKAGAIWTLLRSALAARRLIRRLDAQIVLGTGGYVSVPAVVGAKLAGRPAVLFEPNARAGAANRSLSRWAQSAAVGYESSRADFRCPVHLTGVPVRSEFLEIGAPPAHELRILVLGGSQGALNVNRLLPPAFAALAGEFPGLEIVHQVGRHRDATKEAYAGHDLGTARLDIVPFIEDMASVMASAHLVISRAGAVTLAEICAAGRPAVLIPLSLAGGHQRENAQALVDAGGGEIVEEGAPIEDLVAALRRPLLYGEERTKMGASVAALARRDAAERIAELVMATAGERA